MRIARKSLALPLIGLAFCSSLAKGATVRLELVGGVPFTVGSGGNGPTHIIDTSVDGRFLLLRTRATNLVQGIDDRNGDNDLLVYDRETAELDWITLDPNSPNSTRTGMGSVPGEISNDGRYVIYYRQSQINVFDRATRIETSTNLPSLQELNAVSSDGRWVVVRGKEISGSEVPFLFERTSGTVTQIIYVPDDAYYPVYFSGLASDGSVCFYGTYFSSFIPEYINQNGQHPDLFLYDPSTGNRSLITHAFGTPNSGSNGLFSNPIFSPDGRHVAYGNTGTNLAPNFVGLGVQQTFIYDRADGTNRLLSGIAGSPTHGSNGSSWPLGFSRDGRYLFLASESSDLLPGITLAGNPSPGIFRLDLSTSTFELINHISGAPSTIAEGTATFIGTSADNRFTLLYGTASPLVPGQVGSGPTAFLYDHQTHEAQLLAAYPGQPAHGLDVLPTGISPDGRFIFLESATSIAPEGAASTTTDAFVLDRNGESLRLSTSAVGGISAGLTSVHDIGLALGKVLFHTPAPGLVPGLNDTNRATDPVIYDPWERTNLPLITAAGTPFQAPNNETTAKPLADGRRFVLASKSTDIIPGLNDDNEGTDLFLFDYSTNSLRLISAVPGQASTAGNGASYSPFPTPDGSAVVFQTNASNLTAFIDENATSDILRWDPLTGNSTLITQSVVASNTTADGGSDIVASQSDFVLFSSRASDLISGFVDHNGPNSDLYLYRAGDTTLISHKYNLPYEGSAWPAKGYISADGSLVVMKSSAEDLIFLIDPAQTDHLFLHAPKTGARVHLRPCSSPFPGPGEEYNTLDSIAPDGSWVIFSTVSYYCPDGFYQWHRASGNVTFGRGPAKIHHDRYSFIYKPSPDCSQGIHLQDLATGEYLFIACAAWSSEPVVAPDGSFVAFLTANNQLAPHDVGGVADLFVATINREGLLFSDGFELGDTALWTVVGGNP